MDSNISHKLIDGFLIGKDIISKRGLICNNDQDNDYNKTESCLSPYVTSCSIMMKDTSLLDIAINEIVDTERYVFNWKSLKKDQLVVAQDELSCEAFDMALEEKEYWVSSRNIRRIALALQEHFENNAIPIDKLSKIPHLREYDVMPMYQRFIQDIDYPILTFSLLISKLERHLGDVFYSITKGMKKTPLIIRDLLDSDELISFYGLDIIFFLKSIIGPPCGMNLRNIVWHGFVDPDEFHIAFVNLTLVLFVSLLDLADQKLDLKMRKLLDYSKYTENQFDFGLGGLLNRDRHFYDQELSFIKRLVKETIFIIPSRRDTILTSIDIYNRKTAESNISFIVAVLPIIEHCLRRIFVAVNDLPVKFLYAESKEYYTTIDIILSEYLFDSDIQNKIHQELGYRTMLALFDLLVYPKGPRIRDRLSHGECECNIPQIIPERLLGILIYLCYKYRLVEYDYIPETIQAYIQIYDNYVPCFHPKSIIQRDMWCLNTTLSNLSLLVGSTIIVDEDFNRRIDNQDLHDKIISINSKAFKLLHDEPLSHLFKVEEGYPCLQLKEYLISFDSYTTSSELSTLTKTIEKLLSYSKTLSEKYNSQVEQVNSNSATSRLRNSFYKLLGCIDTLILFISTEALIIIYELKTMKSNQKQLFKIQAHIDKIDHLVIENQWQLTIQTIANLLDLLGSIYTFES